MKQQLVSKSQYDQAIAQRDSLRAQLATAQRNTQVADDQLRIAGHGVDNTIVRAPFAGVVIAKAAQPGEIVSPLSAGGGFTRTGIGTIVDMDSLEVEVDVGEAFIGRVQPEMPVRVHAQRLPGLEDPRPRDRDHSRPPIAARRRSRCASALDVRDPRIVPDMGVRVSFLEKAAPQQAQRQAGVLAPAAAIVQRNGKDIVFVVADDGTAQARPVTLGRTLGDDREVLSGLSGGDTVVRRSAGEAGRRRARARGRGEARRGVEQRIERPACRDC